MKVLVASLLMAMALPGALHAETPAERAVAREAARPAGGWMMHMTGGFRLCGVMDVACIVDGECIKDCILVTDGAVRLTPEIGPLRGAAATPPDETFVGGWRMTLPARAAAAWSVCDGRAKSLAVQESRRVRAVWSEAIPTTRFDDAEVRATCRNGEGVSWSVQIVAVSP